MRSGRRFFIGALGGAVTLFPYYAARSQSVQKEHPVFRVQSSWSENTPGYAVFKDFCETVVERTSGEMALRPYPAGSIRNDLQLYDALKTGALDGLNTFSVYWASRLPAGAFMSSFPGGLSQPSHWNKMLDVYGGRQALQRIYKKLGLRFIDYVHHDINLLHATKPLRTLEDFRDLKVRVPGNLIGDSFRTLRARPLLLPASSIFSALDTGTIDAAEFAGAAVNARAGFHKVARYLILGPHSSPSISQPNDIMDFALIDSEWRKLKPSVRSLFADLVRSYSSRHYAAIQSANEEAWQQMKEDGVTIIRLSENEMLKMRKTLLPLWFSYAGKDADAKNLFLAHFRTMLSDEVNLLSENDVEGYQLS